MKEVKIINEGAWGVASCVPCETSQTLRVAQEES